MEQRPDHSWKHTKNEKNKRPANDRGNVRGKAKVSGNARTAVHSNAKAPTNALTAVQTANPAADQLKNGDVIIVTIKRIGINGEGVGYYKRKAVFIDGALPGETVKAKVTRVEEKLLYADIIELEKRSPKRKQPECPVYEHCGGCQLQHLNYEGQLEAKEELVREAFRRYLGRDDVPVRPIAGMDHPWAYRNKAQLQVETANGRLQTGLYSPGSRRLVDTSGCPIHHPELNRVVRTAADVLRDLNIPVSTRQTGKRTGVRTIVARIGTASGAVQLTFVASEDVLPKEPLLVEEIRKRLPSVETIAVNVNRSSSPLVFGDKTRIIWGKERIAEKLGDVRLELSPRAFLQLNPAQTVRLYDYVKEAAELTGREQVVDAYCGTGTIALWLAPYAREVRGIENIADAVRDAQRNAELNGLGNVRFDQGEAERLLPQWVAAGFRPDVVVVDPPRTGCDRRLLDAVINARPRRFVYVSCNPSTLAKDCKVLESGGFRIEWVQPVDMFPQTSHVEAVCLMSGK